jgi:hypothetical protein
MKNFIKMSLVLMMFALTACGEEKIYTVEELVDNNELREEILKDYQGIEKPTEIEMQNLANAAEAKVRAEMEDMPEAQF